MRLRPALASETEVLTALALRAKAHWGYDDAFMARCFDELAVDAEAILGERCWLVQHGHVIAGFYALAVPRLHRVELDALFVEPELMGQGVGRRLMINAVEHARALGCSAMEIAADPNAAAFYLKFGARQVGERPSASIPGRSLPLLELALA